jgi:signal transduction histidine kinase
MSQLSGQLNEPLRGIRSYLDLMRVGQNPANMEISRLRNPAFWRDFYDQVRQQCQRMATQMVSTGVLAQANAAAGVSVQSVLKAVSEKSALALDQRGIRFTSEVSMELPNLAVGLETLGSLTETLLQTMAISVEAGHAVKLSAKTFPEGPDAGALHLDFIADGHGFPAEVLNSVFNPGHVNNGTDEEAGLKLFGACLLISHLGGRLVVPRGAAPGTHLEVFIPVNAKAVANAQDGRDFITNVLMSDELWERLLPERDHQF